MEEQKQSTSLFQDALKKGVILGVVHIIVFLILYIFFPGKLISMTSMAIALVINIIFLIYDGTKFRKQNGGFLSYGNAFKHGFFMLLFNGFVTLIFFAILLLVDQNLPTTMAQGQVDLILYWAERFGAPENTLDEMKDKMDIDVLKKEHSILGHVKGFPILVIFYALGAAITAIFVKKNEPEIL